MNTLPTDLIIVILQNDDISNYEKLLNYMHVCSYGDIA